MITQRRRHNWIWAITSVQIARAGQTGGNGILDYGAGRQTEREVKEITDLRKWDCGITIGEVLGQHVTAIYMGYGFDSNINAKIFVFIMIE